MTEPARQSDARGTTIDSVAGIERNSNGETTMGYMLSGLIAGWLCGLYLLASLNVRDERRIVSHISPDEQMRPQDVRPSQAAAVRKGGLWLFDALFVGPGIAVAARVFGRIFNLGDSSGVRPTQIDPARLTEDGREHLARAIRNERMLYVWLAAGSVLLIFAGFYFKS
ncbi:hypothetical protein [uncultured Bradyrhizobium sp.]|uniref:hypothetical protein n=1 Tax=uncultured Bradyrhizobium sp. TaxID=199684 RepID=UPI00262BC800|nr:hypothetical protein [uncultured Bradyrhizobium sp.]